MKKILTPLIIAGGLLAIYLLGKKNLAKKITFNLTDIGTSGKFYSPVVNLKFAVNNPTNQQATINAIVGELKLNNKKVADVTNFNQQTINANSQSIVSVDFKPSIVSVVSTLIQAISKKSKNNTFTFEGNANVENIVIPINESIML
jgi:signal recognition particle subunit SEC65